ncbi:ribonucleoside triphosphate reductase [Caldisericum exile]|uniref:Anaerobic ribonucleoside-triphosphate reductase class III n=1 Tax=Caldisericum exile (strain DSM 21853 / NBRC 104410 / AZM16c01) TaxID=511051 RepID=A0A7U6JED0_CALEA|nr:ribonucleoside triphosphate reductase [Caldisericum exile]BAL80328.1 anaerobic ribonucleoside-triphosphate reductase class III [Caldisericum exile AZM16c01]
MIKFVQKRDGRIVPFQKEKITRAILKAGIATHEFGEDVAEYLTNIVLNELIDESEPINIEIIQNKIEEILMRKGFYQTAKAFIIYREKRRELRELRKHLDIPELFDKYIGEETWEIHENANINYSIQGLKAYITGKAEEIYWLEKVYPKKISDYHKDGFVHIHNLSFLGSYCVGWDLEDLIKRGFGGVPGKPYSTPAKHLSSILGQMMNFLFTLQNEAAGAVAFSSFDTLLAPFVYFDKLTYKEVKQQIQEFVYNMNQTMRTGGQSPFSNITIDLTPHPLLKDKPVVIGGKPIKEYTYGMFQKEMDLINKALFEVFIEGDGHGRPFTFPIPTINVSKDFDWDNPVLEPIWESTAKYGTPYFANYINSDLRPEDARSMCCRLRLDTRELKNKGGGLFGANPLTGSVGVITINLPRIAYLSKHNINEFYKMLDEILEASKEGLEKKRETVEKFTEMGLYPYSRIYLEPIKEETGKFWDNHFSTIGIIGMNEALQMLFDRSIHMGTQKGIQNAVEVMLHIRELLQKFQKDTGHLFNLEATPSESTSYSLALKDKKEFPDIITGGSEENPFYTNSTQLPVNYTDDPFELAELQEPVQKLYTGGTVVHFFLGERLYNPNSAKVFVRKILENYELPYITLTPSFSICPKHGYIPGEHEFCPLCDEELKEKARKGELENNKKSAKINVDLKIDI